MSTEVGEHIPQAFADDFVKYIVGQSSKIIAFTAAQPGQNGTAHINLQPRSYWIEKFECLDVLYDETATHDAAAQIKEAGAHFYMHQNLSLFRIQN